MKSSKANLEFACLLAVFLAGCTLRTTDVRESLDQRTPNWEHVRLRGIDTNVGRFELSDWGLAIHYDIGFGAGNYVESMRKDSHWKVQKSGSGNSHGHPYAYVVGGMEDQRPATNTLYVTFPDEGPANYYSEVSGDGDVTFILELLVECRGKLLALPGRPPKESP